MRGRRPRPLEIAPHDVPILQQIARSRSLPWYQVQRAQVLLAVAAGEPIRTLAILPKRIRRLSGGSAVAMRTRACPISWCRNHPNGPGATGRHSRPATCTDRSIGLPGASRQGLAHHPLDEPGSGPPSGRQMESSRPSAIGLSRDFNQVDLQPHRTRYWRTSRIDTRFKERAEKILGPRQRRAVGRGGLLGGLCR